MALAKQGSDEGSWEVPTPLRRPSSDPTTWGHLLPRVKVAASSIRERPRFKRFDTIVGLQVSHYPQPVDLFLLLLPPPLELGLFLAKTPQQVLLTVEPVSRHRGLVSIARVDATRPFLPDCPALFRDFGEKSLLFLGKVISRPLVLGLDFVKSLLDCSAIQGSSPPIRREEGGSPLAHSFVRQWNPPTYPVAQTFSLVGSLMPSLSITL